MAEAGGGASGRPRRCMPARAMFFFSGRARRWRAVWSSPLCIARARSERPGAPPSPDHERQSLGVYAGEMRSGPAAAFVLLMHVCL